MIAIHRDPIVVALTDVRRTMEALRLMRPLPYAELALLHLEELRLLRADCARRGN